MFDSFMGVLSSASNNLIGTATKSMQIKYLKPIKVNEEYRMHIWVEKLDGRNLFLKGVVKDFEGKEYAIAESNFVAVNWISSSYWKDALEIIK